MSTGLGFLAAATLSHGQALSPKPLPTTELERYDDPPAYVWRNDVVSPGMVSQHDSFTSYQANVNANGQNIVGDAANEPSICVDPTNGSKMAIGWRQFNSVTSNFRQSGWGFTSNGGQSWTFPGVLENNVFRSDPVLGADSTGSFFYLSLLQSFFDDMWQSVNGGQSWTRLASATGGDKQWFTIDNTNSSGHGFQYQIWSTGGNNYGGRQFSRSTDGGFTWLNPINMPGSPAWGTLDVDANGTLFIGGVNLNTGQIWCDRSSNAKNSAVSPTFDQSTPVNLGGAIASSEPINPVGLVGQIFLAADRSGTSTNNNIYLLAAVQPTGFTTGSDVMFVRSTNGGQSFSTPKRINDDPVNHAKWHWMAALAVAPNGRLDALWLDTRNAANNTDSQLYYSYSVDGGTTWSTNVSVSNAFNPFLGYPNQNKMGDYLTVVSDNTGANVAYTATFNQEEDVYSVRVGPSAPLALGAVSRKVHGAAGVFDLPLPLSGPAGIECRNGSGPNFDGHQVVITFANAVSVGGVTVTSADGLATATQSVSGATVTVNLSNVSDAQTLTITLNNVNDGTNFGAVPISMAVLLGDVNRDRTVNTGDAVQTRAHSGEAANATNFPFDVNTDGSVNAGDTARVRSRSGTFLP
ncbi:MAG: dockerin type I domain-containing protein [Chthoniobacterales bacterium]